MDELKVYNANGKEIHKPFIFTSGGTIDFYGSPSQITIIETAPVDDKQKPFYFNMTKDEEHNYEIVARFNPYRVMENITRTLSLGTAVKQFFGF